jgi:Predicted periplasmic protein (DUF2092)
MFRWNRRLSRPHALRIRPSFIALPVVVALFALAGCSLPGATQAKPTPTLSAEQILTSAKNAHLTDETFTLTIQGTSNGTALNVTGNGKGTESPSRMALTISTEAAGTTVSIDMIVDVATNAVYTRITEPATLATTTWTKADTSSSSIPVTDLQLTSQYSKVSNPKLIGSEQVNGVATWHIQGTNTDTSGGTTDFYVRQSDYLPVKMVLHATSGATVDMTIVFTAVNTGISIDLPPPEDIK